MVKMGQYGNVEKSRQRRSRPFAVLTYMSTLRSSKWLRPCWTNFFEHSLPLTMRGSSGAFLGCWSEIFNSPISHVRGNISPSNFDLYVFSRKD